MDLLSDPTQKLLTKWLDASATRHRVLCDNLANCDTPGFTRRDVAFDAELALARDTRRGAIQISEDRAGAARQDGNNVVMDQELAELSKNALMQQMAVQLLQAKLSMSKIAATGKT